MMTLCVTLLAIVSLVYSAPVDVLNDEGPRPHRESTKEILDLEQQLKAQAGENKQFFPSQEIPMLPPADIQLDGSGDDDDQNALEEMKPRIVLDALADKDAPIENHIKRADTEADTESDQPMEAIDTEPSDEIEALNANKDVLPDEQENEVEEEENYNEKLFLQSVMETLKEHPEMIRELLGEVPQNAEEEEEDVVPPGMDTEDRDEEIKAQIMQAAADNNRNVEAESNGYDPEDELREQQEETHVGDTSDDTDEESQRGYGSQYNAMPMSNNLGSEYYQKYQGDTLAKVVKKGGYGRPVDYANQLGVLPPNSDIPSESSGEIDNLPKGYQRSNQDDQDMTMEELKELKEYFDQIQQRKNLEEELKPLVM